ncbi:MAG: hypothetical protein HY698_00875 [Deltaproteobacteria bacterium]|nr:hypothetical protein [Deltaproteobacteria bacterium]
MASLIGGLQAGCSSDLPKPQLVDNLRIAAVRAEPAEGGPGTEVTLDALLLHPDPSARFELAWLACVLPAGANPAACTSSTSLPPTCAEAPDATLCLIGAADQVSYRLPRRALEGRAPGHPGQVIVTLAAGLVGRGGLASCVGSGEAGSEEMPAMSGEGCRAAVKRVNVLPLGMASANRNPQITSLALEGERVSIALKDDSIEETEQGQETVFLSWYVTVGEIEKFHTDPDEEGLTNEWTPADAMGTIAVVARDTRGGVGWIRGSRSSLPVGASP